VLAFPATLLLVSLLLFLINLINPWQP